jgi:hypothetical protein
MITSKNEATRRWQAAHKKKIKNEQGWLHSITSHKAAKLAPSIAPRNLITVQKFFDKHCNSITTQTTKQTFH